MAKRKLTKADFEARERMLKNAAHLRELAERRVAEDERRAQKGRRSDGGAGRYFVNEGSASRILAPEASSTTGFASSPIPSISTSTRSPAFSDTGGVRA